MERREFISYLYCTILLPKWLISQETKYGNIFDHIINKALNENWSTLPISEVFVNVSLEFLDFPYLGGSLDVDLEEKCIVTFEGFDCFTFFEVSLCFARIIKKRKFTFYDLVDEVTYTRYRGGKIQDYSSRLHYSSDWIYDNIQKGVVQDRTAKLGGTKITFEVNYMSAN
ncbi:MAG: N-acetylmuramoyl-L-alanine amidase-like domain-containing protein, partial [Candidatus Kapaibacteriota bacterium]